LEISKSKGGFFTKRIGTQRHEIEHEEKARQKDTGFREKIQNKLGFGSD